MAVEALNKVKAALPDLADEFNGIIDAYNSKLWHQVTVQLEHLVHLPVFDKGNALAPLKETLLREIHTRINALSLVRISLRIFRQEADYAVIFADIESLKSIPNVKNSQNALLLCQVTQADIKLTTNELKEAKTLIEELQEQFESIDGIGPIHKTFYEVSSRYYQIQSNHALYYREALRYLACIDVMKDLSDEERKNRSLFIGLAAVLGEGVYNFGELLAHPILESLKNSSNAWVADLLFAFNSGDVSAFETLRPQWSAIPDLAAAEQKMRQKISLLCLMEMAFRMPANNRNLTFAEVSNTVKISLDDVELLVMKALSLGLIRGCIDEVDKIIHVTWVSPRVLSREQLAVMSRKLCEWQTEIVKVEHLLNDGAKTIIGY